MNIYIEDSKVFFGNAAKAIDNNMDKGTLIIATMSFALAMERVLKGILYDVNPVYILMNPVFKNSISVLYTSKVINNNTEVSDKPDGDVITYRTSLLRAEVISEFAHKNKSFLFYLSECRDIIAHNELSKLDFERMSLMLKRDFYPMSQQIASDFSINIHNLLSHQDTRISNISAALQESVPDAIAITLDMHKRKWDNLKKTPGYIDSKDKVHAEILLTSYKFQCECPACSNNAILYTKPEIEFNRYINQEIIAGYFITKLKCVYCKLEVTDYDHISYLDEQHKYQLLIEKSLDDSFSA